MCVRAHRKCIARRRSEHPTARKRQYILNRRNVLERHHAAIRSYVPQLDRVVVRAGREEMRRGRRERAAPHKVLVTGERAKLRLGRHVPADGGRVVRRGE